MLETGVQKGTNVTWTHQENQRGARVADCCEVLKICKTGRQNHNNQNSPCLLFTGN